MNEDQIREQLSKLLPKAIEDYIADVMASSAEYATAGKMADHDRFAEFIVYNMEVLEQEQ